ncbi:MAG: NADH-quinone oxidoreductase subunit J family protein [Anaerolineales bacterium]
MTPLQIIFLITAVLTFGSAMIVVTVRNLVHAALSLIVTLFGVAVLFVLLEAGFLAVVQVVLYIGAISILIIFAIMLTRRVMQDAGPQTNRQWWLGAIIAVALFAALGAVLSPVFPFAGSAQPPAVPGDSLAALGKSFVDPNQYVIPFEVASVLLLAALIGSIVIAGDSK